MKSIKLTPALACLLLSCAGATGPRQASGDGPAAPSTSAAPVASSASAPASSAAPVASSAAVPAPAASAAPTPVASAAPPPFPGVDCNDESAAPNLRHIACTNDCDKKLGAACELLGDLHAREESLPEPVSSAGSALNAWGRACELGVQEACAKREALLASLTKKCQAKPKQGCVVLGDAIAELPGEKRREEAEVLYQKACRAGSAVGCSQSGDLHAQWEPHSVHDKIAEQLYTRACNLDSDGACCSLVAWYENREQWAKADYVRRRLKGLLAVGCGSGGRPPRPQPQAKVDVRLSAETKRLISENEAALVKRFFVARGRACHAITVLNVDPDRKAKVVARLALRAKADGSMEYQYGAASPAEFLNCLRASALRLTLPANEFQRLLVVEIDVRPP